MTATKVDPDRAAALEAGRLLFARPWTFLRGASSVASLPPADGIEIAFAGRSNVGKSSLINALVGQKALARTSNTPGRTQELNFFVAEAGLTIVDMPGYGYAQAPKDDGRGTGPVSSSTSSSGRSNLRRVYVLIDARHGVKANDLEALELLDKAAVSYQLVLTKADKLKPARARHGRRGDAGGDRQAPGGAPGGARHVVGNRRRNPGIARRDRGASSPATAPPEPAGAIVAAGRTGYRNRPAPEEFRRNGRHLRYRDRGRDRQGAAHLGGAALHAALRRARSSW